MILILTHRILKEMPTATRIATVAGYKLFEDPINGDEAPLICQIKSNFWRTDFYDVPTVEELLESLPGLA